jgi:hypothetical protein
MMAGLEKIWRWGIVLPTALLALAGGLADVATGTMNFWYLLAPFYPVIGVLVWRRTSPKAQEEAEAKAWAAVEAKLAEDGLPPLHRQTDRWTPTSVGEKAPEMLVSVPRRITVWSILGAIVGNSLRLVMVLGLTFICMVAIWGAISIATWGRGYWYVYGPVLAGIGWIAWLVLRSERVTGAAPSSGNDRMAP